MKLQKLISLALFLVLLGLIFPCITSAQDNFLTPVQVLTDGVDGVDGLNGVNSIAISPDGKHLYTASSGDFSVAFFQRNVGTGTLNFVEQYRDNVGGVDGLDGARSVITSPDGQYVYAVGQDDRAVAVFSRNSTSGKLTFIQKFDLGQYNSGDLVFVTISPDGRDLYIATDQGRANNGDSVTSAIWQSRLDPSNGKLTEEGELYQDNYQIDNLGGFIAMAVSPDGKHLYATARNDKALNVFARDSSNGTLALVEVEVHRDGGEDGLQSPTSVFVSSDGKHVYVVSPNSPYTIATYSRNLSSGEVDFVDTQKHDGIPGSMISPIFGTISPSGGHVFVSAASSHTVTVFNRSEATGRLAYSESVDRFDLEDWSAMLEPEPIAVSPDGAFVYVGGFQGDSLITFKTAEGGAPPPPPGNFQINAGLNGSWYYPGTDGQGFLIDVFPESSVMFVAWFTYDTEKPDDSVTANLGDPSQRWLTAQGAYADNQAVLDVYISGGGLFDMYPPVPTREKDGTLTIEFSNCNAGTVTYDIPSIGRQGVIPIERIVTENVPLCESLNEMMQSNQ